MSWHSEFYSALTNDSAFMDVVTSLSMEFYADAETPYATYQLISASGTNDLDGVSPEGERRIQLNIVANSPTEANNIAEKAISAVNATLSVHDVFERSLQRSEDGDFGYAVDFLIWFQNP